MAPVTSAPQPVLLPPIDREMYPRRRSVDVGGLSLCLTGVPLGEEGTGKGWGGWDEDDGSEAHFAQLLSDMFTQIQSMVSIPVLSPPPVIPEDTRRRLIIALDSWNFEPHKLPDEEALACATILFEALFRVEGMREVIDVSLAQLDSFLRHLRQSYRSLNTFHNFQHALDVFQATYTFLRSADVIPPVSILLTDPGVLWKKPKKCKGLISLLTNEDLFALYVAAVGHDVGHPGFNNIFMKNAQTPLSQVYDHKSALERMHCAFLIPIMKQHGLGPLLDRSNLGIPFRRLLFETILATDMGVHEQFMQRFGKLVASTELKSATASAGVGVGVNGVHGVPANNVTSNGMGMKNGPFDVPQTRVLLCQALIKCADISNPSRPHPVSQHWSAALAAEWANQALLEKQLSLPISFRVTFDPVDEAKGQIFFINTFALPLFEATASALSELKWISEQCTKNCLLWKKRMEVVPTEPEPSASTSDSEAAASTPPTAGAGVTPASNNGRTRSNTVPPSSPMHRRSSSPILPQDYMTVLPLSLPAELLPSPEVRFATLFSPNSMKAGEVLRSPTTTRSPSGSISTMAESRSRSRSPSPSTSPMVNGLRLRNGSVSTDGLLSASANFPSTAFANETRVTCAPPPPPPRLSTTNIQPSPSTSPSESHTTTPYYSPISPKSETSSAALLLNGSAGSGSSASSFCSACLSAGYGSGSGSGSGSSSGCGYSSYGFGIGCGGYGCPNNHASMHQNHAQGGSIYAAYRDSVRRKKSFHRCSWTGVGTGKSLATAGCVNESANSSGHFQHQLQHQHVGVGVSAITAYPPLRINGHVGSGRGSRSGSLLAASVGEVDGLGVSVGAASGTANVNGIGKVIKLDSPTSSTESTTPPVLKTELQRERCLSSMPPAAAVSNTTVAIV